MTLIILGIIVYLVGWACATVICYRRHLKDFKSIEPDLLVALPGIFWPFLLLPWAMFKIAKYHVTHPCK